MKGKGERDQKQTTKRGKERDQNYRVIQEKRKDTKRKNETAIECNNSGKRTKETPNHVGKKGKMTSFPLQAVKEKDQGRVTTRKETMNPALKLAFTGPGPSTKREGSFRRYPNF